jgi:4-hydroxymandelate oxidase
VSATELNALNLAELEPLARERLDPATYHYFAGGAADELTMHDNRAAFDRLALVPRVLRGLRERSSVTTVLGAQVAHPVVVAPVAYQRAAHPDGELAIARAAAATGTGMCLSSLATSTLGDVAAAAGPDAPLFFQLYPYHDLGMTEVIHRARAAGYRALLVTVDVPVHARRERQLRHPFVLPDDWGCRASRCPATTRGR